MAKVSHVTMWKAVVEAKEIGLLFGERGHRIIVGRFAPSTKPPLTTSPSTSALLAQESMAADSEMTVVWDKIRRHIKRDILAGRYRAGTALPSSKELQFRYGVCFQTLRKALHSLCGDGILEPRGHGYAVQSLRPRTSTSQVVLLHVQIFESHDEFFVRALEEESARSGIALDIIKVICDSGGDYRFHWPRRGTPYNLRKNGEVLGYLYLVNTQDDPHDRILHELHLLKRPTAVLDLTGSWAAPQFVLTSPHFQVFTMSVSARASEIVGRFLLGLGHRRVAYCSPYHKLEWSQNRLEGLRASYRAAGLPEGVKEFTFREMGLTREFLAGAIARPDVPRSTESMERWQNAPVPFQHQMQWLIDHAIRGSYAQGEIYMRSVPLFERALSQLDDGGISAWVLANDLVASMALDFLSRKRIRVPDQLSVMAFDNSILSTRDRITSYDLNTQAVVDAMLRFVVRPDYLRGLKRSPVIEIEGRVIERETTSSVQIP